MIGIELITESINAPNFILKTTAATISGLLIGLEREYKGKSAGLKTNTLVAIGACTFVIISLQYEHQFGVDITRVLSQVIVGIGFLGAGVILQKEDKIKGLTTAATIWCSAAAGCLAAAGLYVELALMTILVVLINVVFGYVDTKIEKNKKRTDD
ncbi:MULTISPECIES: MgtC/SapB family protein [Galbibacter]|uniref:MgtC/SapB family protein n=1 Tax=Galbibacter pacificus TaxID=2996052 RepID=A0ABT6FQ80_9FLAO|nr:MgtC/SapB family protein [Galbibacter pacificus]MDG3582102.1 MgtC/SapB family protein [Galbibacter pacificus]MDG3585422.1 MgtC/SapB family protein [Galbibacter pacificus]